MRRSLGRTYFGRRPGGRLRIRHSTPGRSLHERWGLGGWEPGEWTDDTQMAICVSEASVDGPPSPIAVGTHFLKWFRSRPADVGLQTRYVLSTAEDASDLSNVAASCFQRNPHSSSGNGSLMRTAPIPLSCLGQDKRLVESATSISALTHADPLAGEACALCPRRSEPLRCPEPIPSAAAVESALSFTR